VAELKRIGEVDIDELGTGQLRSEAHFIGQMVIGVLVSTNRPKTIFSIKLVFANSIYNSVELSELYLVRVFLGDIPDRHPNRSHLTNSGEDLLRSM